MAFEIFGVRVKINAGHLQQQRTFARRLLLYFYSDPKYHSTMIRYGLKPSIFLLNNGGYTVEVEIHDGPYNIINNRNYAALIEVFSNDARACCMVRQVRMSGELNAAL